MRRALLPMLIASLSGCGGETPPAHQDPETSEPVTVTPAGEEWSANPRDGIQIERQGSATLVVTGPHTVLWKRGAGPLVPPYTVSARLHKVAGRIHEGYGLVFGGTSLDAPEDQQAYSYFLIRGDGSFLIRRREGPSLPILQSWTSAPAIRRDTNDAGQPNELTVDVGSETTAFRVNGEVVARLLTADLRVEGLPGLRVAHDVRVEVSDFAAIPEGR